MVVSVTTEEQQIEQLKLAAGEEAEVVKNSPPWKKILSSVRGALPLSSTKYTSSQFGADVSKALEGFGNTNEESQEELADPAECHANIREIIGKYLGKKATEADVSAALDVLYQLHDRSKEGTLVEGGKNFEATRPSQVDNYVASQTKYHLYNSRSSAYEGNKDTVKAMEYGYYIDGKGSLHVATKDDEVYSGIESVAVRALASVLSAAKDAVRDKDSPHTSIASFCSTWVEDDKYKADYAAGKRPEKVGHTKRRGNNDTENTVAPQELGSGNNDNQSNDSRKNSAVERAYRPTPDHLWRK